MSAQITHKKTQRCNKNSTLYLLGSIQKYKNMKTWHISMLFIKKSKASIKKGMSIKKKTSVKCLTRATLNLCMKTKC